MNSIIDEIRNRLSFDGFENSFELVSDSISELEDVEKGDIDFCIILDNNNNEIIEESFHLISIIYANSNVTINNVIDGLIFKISEKHSSLFISNGSKIFDFYIQLYFIFNDLAFRYKSEYIIDTHKLLTVKNLKEKIPLLSTNKSFKSNNINISYDFIPLIKKSDLLYKIDVLSRVQKANYQHNNNDLIGSVFTAKLRDVVRVYEIRSNDLFKDNVRYGIADNNLVDFSITKTLKETPSDFWFLNNGITIFSENEIDISSKQSVFFNTSNFSVINGAQTITSATKFFFTETDNDIVRIAEENAYVILRIVEGKKSYVNSITIGLNRQKPITIDDIAFLNQEVSNLNILASDQDNIINGDFSFQIVRRGEAVSIDNHFYDLASVSRIITAVKLKRPGFARSGGINQILNKKSINKVFVELTDGNDFIKKYGFVNHAMKLEESISNYNKSKTVRSFINIEASKKEEFNAILKYGKYYLISAYINAQINGKELNENFVFKDFSDQDYISLLIKFHGAWTKHHEDIPDKNKIWDSNMFKSDRLINDKSILDSLIESIND